MSETALAPVSTPIATHRRVVRGYWGDVWAAFLSQSINVAAALMLLVVVVVAMLAPFVAPYDPIRQFRDIGFTIDGQPVAPNSTFWMGTDGAGRDLFSRVVFGARISLGIGITASLLSTLIAVLVGGSAGMIGGMIDQILMRFVDLMLSIPAFFVMLLLVTVFRPSVFVAIGVIVVFGWAGGSRIFRAEVVSLKERDFVVAARVVGVPEWQIFLRHIVPNLLPLLIVGVTLGIPGAIFAEAGLSYLGLGVPAPTPTWGTIIQEGTTYYRAAPWLILFPGATLLLTVVSINLIGSGLRDALDPTTRGR